MSVPEIIIHKMKRRIKLPLFIQSKYFTASAFIILIIAMIIIFPDIVFAADSLLEKDSDPNNITELTDLFDDSEIEKLYTQTREIPEFLKIGSLLQVPVKMARAEQLKRIIAECSVEFPEYYPIVRDLFVSKNNYNIYEINRSITEYLTASENQTARFTLHFLDNMPGKTKVIYSLEKLREYFYQNQPFRINMLCGLLGDYKNENIKYIVAEYLERVFKNSELLKHQFSLKQDIDLLNAVDESISEIEIISEIKVFEEMLEMSKLLEKLAALKNETEAFKYNYITALALKKFNEMIQSNVSEFTPYFKQLKVIFPSKDEKELIRYITIYLTAGEVQTTNDYFRETDEDSVRQKIETSLEELRKFFFENRAFRINTICELIGNDNSEKIAAILSGYLERLLASTQKLKAQYLNNGKKLKVNITENNMLLELISEKIIEIETITDIEIVKERTEVSKLSEELRVLKNEIAIMKHYEKTKTALKKIEALIQNGVSEFTPYFEQLKTFYPEKKEKELIRLIAEYLTAEEGVKTHLYIQSMKKKPGRQEVINSLEKVRDYFHESLSFRLNTLCQLLSNTDNEKATDIVIDYTRRLFVNTETLKEKHLRQGEILTPLRTVKDMPFDLILENISEIESLSKVINTKKHPENQINVKKLAELKSEIELFQVNHHIIQLRLKIDDMIKNENNDFSSFYQILKLYAPVKDTSPEAQEKLRFNYIIQHLFSTLNSIDNDCECEQDKYIDTLCSHFQKYFSENICLRTEAICQVVGRMEPEVARGILRQYFETRKEAIYSTLHIIADIRKAARYCSSSLNMYGSDLWLKKVNFFEVAHCFEGVSIEALSDSIDECTAISKLPIFKHTGLMAEMRHIQNLFNMEFKVPDEYK